MISSNYEHRHNHYHFLRGHTGDAPERSDPISGWGIEVLRFIGIAALCAIALVVLVGLSS